jgi:hypothetical protein
MAVKVPVLRVGMQRQGLMKLLDLRMGRGGVRWLGTDGVVENRGECGGDGLPEADRIRIVWTTSKTEGSFYSCASHGRNMGLRKERGREVTA